MRLYNKKSFANLINKKNQILPWDSNILLKNSKLKNNNL